MFTPDLDLKVVLRNTKFSIQDKTGVDTGDGTKWEGGTGLDVTDLATATITVTAPSGTVLAANDVFSQIPDPVTGEWWYNNIPGTLEDGLHTLTYRLTYTATINITAFEDYDSTVAGTTKVTSSTHGMSTGYYIIISGSTNYDGEYYVTVLNATSFYITKEFTTNETATGTKLLQSFFYPYVYAISESGIEKMYSNISRMVKGTTRDAYIEKTNTANGLLNCLKSSISSGNTTAMNAIQAELTQIFDFYEIDPNI